MRFKALYLWSMAAAVLLTGCGEQPETTAETTENQLDIHAEAPLIRVGYVKQDHHSAMFVAALRGEEMSELYPVHLVHLGEDFYALIKDGVKVAEIQTIQSQGAMEVPNNMTPVFSTSGSVVLRPSPPAMTGARVSELSPHFTSTATCWLSAQTTIR